MQLNRERRRKIRNGLHKMFPKDGSPELELWERNQQLSPLLRLPPELRNRIYELVLDVGQIHVCFKKWEHKARTRNGQRYYDTTEGGFWCRVLERDQNPWQSVTSMQPVPTRGMTLLSPVCRQLYHETALLPYSLNAWSFETHHVMERYLIKEKRLPRQHRRAIKLLYSQHVLPSPVEKYFGGLEKIMLEYGITMTKGVDDADSENPRHQSSAWEVSRHVWK
ncbi:F-box domain-containing protein [Madurella fahalii]|uniref:F-box domain-containing protein n=1 Tax=Madurella fahalii TaxID=1157608 RepID=A0ABQ0GLV2_9PEZI